MGVEVKITDNSGEVLRAFERQSAAALEAIGITAEGFAKRSTPVDTGRLRNSISHTVVGSDVYIGTNVEYGPYIELGTVNYIGKHMLKNAAANHGELYKQIIETYLKK